jgi:hypothetical protein
MLAALNGGVKTPGKKQISMPVMHTAGKRGSYVVLDIDSEKYNQGVESELLTLAEAGVIAIFASPSSGRLKGILPVRHDFGRGGRWRDHMMATVRAVCGDWIADAIDPAGMFLCFVNVDVLKSFELAKKITPHKIGHILDLQTFLLLDLGLTQMNHLFPYSL